MRRVPTILLGVFLLANATAASEPDDAQSLLSRDLSLRIEAETGQLAAERSRAALELPPLGQPASMWCVDYSNGAAECRVVLVGPIRVSRSSTQVRRKF